MAAYIYTTGEAAFRLLPFHSEFSRFSDGSKLIALLNVLLSLSQDSGTKIRIISESTFIVS